MTIEQNRPCPLCGAAAQHYPCDHDNAVHIKCETCRWVFTTRTILRRIATIRPEDRQHLCAMAQAAPEGQMLLIKRPSIEEERAGKRLAPEFVPVQRDGRAP